MNFALLWIDSLLAALLWVALLVACAARSRRRLLRVAAVGLIVGVPLLNFVAFACFGIAMKYSAEAEPNWCNYFVSLLLVYIVATVFILRKAFRGQPGMPPAAATWSRAPILIAFLIANSIAYMTVLDMDLAIRARCATLSVEVNSLYRATLPAITSDSQNAAMIYDKVFAKLREAPPLNVNNPPLGSSEKFDPAEPATLAYLAQHTSTVAMLHRAAAMSGCRFDQDVADPNINEMMSSLGAMRSAYNLLSLHAREELANGRVSSAIADADSIIQLGQHCGQRPMLISVLTAYGLSAGGAKTLEEVLPSAKSQDELAALHLQDPSSPRRILQQAFRSEERYFLHSMMIDPSELGLDHVATIPPTGTGARQTFFRIFVLNPDGYIRLMEKLQRLSLLPYYRAKLEIPTKQNSKAAGIFASLIADGEPREFKDCAQVEAYAACAQVAVAMTQYRLDHSGFPGHLADLVPTYLDSVPIDPFDGHELRRVIKDGKDVIYSIGPDSIDNGGATMSDDGKGDITFTLTAPTAHTAAP